MARIRLLLAMTLLVVSVRTADAERPQVAGHVKDDSGRMLPGVTVRLHAAGGPQVVETASNESGWYRLDAAPGRYELRFSLVNFGEVRKHIVVAENVPLVVNAVPRASRTSTHTRRRRAPCG